MPLARSAPRRPARVLSLRGAMLWNSVAALALPLSAVLTGPIMARALGPDGRGALSAALAPTLLAAGLVNLGLPSAVLYFVSRGHRPAVVLARALPFSLAVGAAAAAVLVALEPVLLRQYPDQRWLYVGIAITLPLVLVVEVLRYASQGAGEYRLPLVERWVTVGLRTALLVLAFAAGLLTTDVAGWVSWLPGVLVGLVYARLWRRIRHARGPSVTRRGLTGYALRAWIGNVAGVLVFRLDQVLLAVLTAPSQLGFYVVAVAVSEVPVMAVGSIAEILTGAAASRGDPGLVARTNRVALLLTGLAALAGIALAPVAVPLLFGDSFAAAVPATQVLLVASVCSTGGTVLGAGLAALGRPGLESALRVLTVVLAAGSLVLLAPPLGGLGAALSSALSYAGGAVLALVGFTRTSGLSARTCLLVQRADLDHAVTLLRARLRPGR